MAEASLFFEVVCLWPGALRHQDGGGIARAEGLASKVQKCATAPVRRSMIAEEPCGQGQSFSSSFDLFFFRKQIQLLERALKGIGDEVWIVVSTYM